MSILLQRGDTFAGCKLISPCGKGTYGVVYLAENALGQHVVIKVVVNGDNSTRELKGLKLYTRISESHPHLLRVFHVGEFQEGFYYTMEVADDLGEDGEYLPGTLGNMLRSGKTFPPEEACRIIRDLLSALDVMHTAGLLHRDIKPDNVVFVNGKAKLSDPGLVAEATAQNSMAGTPGFIPPEMVTEGKNADKKSDLYAMGKLFYCMVTGNAPCSYPQLPESMPFSVRRQIFPALARMCNRNPAKRFSSVEEFLKNLPERISPPNFWERKYRNFCDWKNLNQEKFRFLLYLFVIVFLLCSAAAGSFLYLQYRQEREFSAWQKETRDFLAADQHRRELLELQIAAFLPDELKRYSALKKNLLNCVKGGEWRNAALQVRELKHFLGEAAEKLLPVIPEKTTSFKEEFAVAGTAQGFLAAPLAACLAPEKMRRFKKQLAGVERRLYSGWAGPRCQGEWNTFNNFMYPMVFLPPGAVRMDHFNEIAKIPYHFWISKNEVTNTCFSYLMGIAPQFSTRAGTPVERVAWNDILHFCRGVTISLQNRGLLPPGYIVRPPTEAEWEYAAKNGWLGRDSVPFAQRAVFRGNSQKKLMVPGTKQPNKLGINDIYGNVSEIVLPYKRNALNNSVVIRGGSFLSSEKRCFARVPYLKYQYIPFDIGFRIVIGPGEMEYFDRHFFTGGTAQMKTQGRIFELLGENLSSFSREKADAICRLLGGRLAELNSPELLQSVMEKLPLAAMDWGCILGGEERDGVWRWISTSKKIDFGKWHTPKGGSKSKYLMLRNKKWERCFARSAAIFLCQWDEKEFAARKSVWEKKKAGPEELLRFTVNGRRFILFNIKSGWYTARRFCELLGGELASLDTPEVQKAVVEKLAPYEGIRIFLGGYAKFGKWVWLSGKETDLKIKDSPLVIPSLNRNFITLHKGSFKNSQFASGFLCEWRSENSSSNLR